MAGTHHNQIAWRAFAHRRRATTTGHYTGISDTGGKEGGGGGSEEGRVAQRNEGVMGRGLHTHCHLLWREGRAEAAWRGVANSSMILPAIS